MMKDREENRFEIHFVKGSAMALRHLVDWETGVNYLFSDFGGFAPLYNADGTLVVTKKKDEALEH